MRALRNAVTVLVLVADCVDASGFRGLGRQDSTLRVWKSHPTDAAGSLIAHPEL